MDLTKYLAPMVDRSRLSKNDKYQEPLVQPIFFIHLYEYTDQMDVHDFNTPDPPSSITESYIYLWTSHVHMIYHFRSVCFSNCIVLLTKLNL